MKLAILAILLVALAAAESSSRESCQREMSQRSLNKCRSFMRSGTQQEEMLITDQDNDDTENAGAPRMCCEQLRQMREECRCDVIKNMMQQMAEEEGCPQGGQQGCSGRCGEMMMRAKFLPAMCSMAPHTCKIRSAGGSRIGMVV